ncbi:MAG: alpha/beta fold hydrolase [Planctomycetota bacterium]
MKEWTIEGSGGLPIHGNTHTPDGGACAHVVLVHGFAGCKDRNIVPALTRSLGSACVVHRCTLSHAGVAKDADRITDHDAFSGDSLAHCVEDVRRVVAHLGMPAGLPFVLIGHSRGGATVLRCASESSGAGWARTPDGVVSVAGTATYTRFSEAMATELAERGFVERACARADGGAVRLGRSWYEHHLDEPGRDLFREDCARVACPVLIVHGDADATVPIEDAERTRGLLASGVCPSVRVVRVEGGDHNLNSGGFGFDRANIETDQTRLATVEILRFIRGL